MVRVIAEPPAVERDGHGGRVVQLNPVVAAFSIGRFHARRAGQDFADEHAARVGGAQLQVQLNLRGAVVGQARRGGGALLPLIIEPFNARPALILGQVVVGNGIDHLAQHVAQEHRFALGAQTEVRVQVAGGIGTVFAGGEHDQIFARLHRRALGEAPLHAIVRIVGQRVVRQIDHAAGAVIQLDPVGVVAVLIGDAGEIGGHDFVDDQAVGGRHTDAARLFPAGGGVFIAGGVLIGRLPDAVHQRVGLVALQGGNLDRIDRLARGVEQKNRLAQRGDFEPRVQRFARLRFVRAVAEDDHTRARFERHFGEDEQHPVVAVGKAGALEALRRAAGVGDFHPVGIRAGFVGIGALVGAHYLGDGQRGIFQRGDGCVLAAVGENDGLFRARFLGQQKHQAGQHDREQHKQQAVAHGRAAFCGLAAGGLIVVRPRIQCFVYPFLSCPGEFPERMHYTICRLILQPSKTGRACNAARSLL